MYAEVLRIQGNSLLAIDAYNSYIRQFPDDVLTQLKLAMLYVENNILDAAELMLDYILRIKPNLEAAWVVKNQLIHLKMHAKETVS
jgi:tetratricopeptide (TPR) repeat protein